MVHNPRRFALTIALILLTLATGSASAQEAPESPEVGVCLPGAGYASGCDVDQDGDIDIFDIQLTAGRWNSSGVYTSGHTHWGETWTGAVGAAGLPAGAHGRQRLHLRRLRPERQQRRHRRVRPDHRRQRRHHRRVWPQ